MQRWSIDMVACGVAALLLAACGCACRDGGDTATARKASSAASSGDASGGSLAELDVEQYALDSSVSTDLLRKDLDMLRKLARKMATPLGAQALREAFGSDVDFAAPKDRGYGLSLAKGTLSGGYGYCDVAIALYQEALVAVGVRCSWHEDLWPRIERFVTDALNRLPATMRLKQDGRRAAATWWSTDGRARARATVAQVLGPTTVVHVPTELAEAYQVLTDPTSELIVGHFCGHPGDIPAGRSEMGDLVNAKRRDLLRNVLRGLNPEGRVYGALGLSRLEPVDPADAATIAKLRESELTVLSCVTCMFRRANPAETLDDVMVRDRK